MQGISKSRVKAGAALGRMKARGKTLAGKSMRTHASGETRSLKMMRNAILAVKVQNETNRPPAARKARMRVFVEGLMGMNRCVCRFRVCTACSRDAGFVAGSPFDMSRRSLA